MHDELKQDRLASQVDEDTLALAARILAITNFGSVSMLRRKLHLGFTAACLLMEALEYAGVVTDVGNTYHTREVNIRDPKAATQAATDWWQQHNIPSQLTTRNHD